MERLTGIGVSPGVAIGRAVVLAQPADVVRFPVAAARVDREVAALERAREESRHQLLEIRSRLATGPARDLAPLFDAQLLMLDDPLLVGRALGIIRHEHVNAAWALHRAYEELRRVFGSMDDPYLRERETDVADVAGRLRMNLSQRGAGLRDLLRDLDGPSILVADELTASLAAQPTGRASRDSPPTPAAGPTTPPSSPARSACRPWSASTTSRRGWPPAPSWCSTGPPARSRVTVARRRRGARRRAARPRRRYQTTTAAAGPLHTADGVRVRLDANIELVEDLPFLHESGAGVSASTAPSSCCRVGRSTTPTRRSCQAYRSVLEQVAPPRHHSHLRRRRARRRARSRHVRPPGPTRAPRPAPGLAHPEVLGTQLRAWSGGGPRAAARDVSVRDRRGRNPQARALLAQVCRDLTVRRARRRHGQYRRRHRQRPAGPRGRLPDHRHE